MENAEVTNGNVNETQVPSTVGNEENTITNPETQNQVQEPQQEEQGNVENSNQEEQQPEDLQQQSQEQPVENKKPTVEELQSRLKDYELKEEEDRLLRERLGLQDISQESYNFMNIDQQIVNEGKQVYLRLCNDYGVDANPNNIDKSLEELKKTDPAKAYEFQRRFDNLSNEVIAKRNEVKQQNTYYEINKFNNEYGQLLQAAPALNNIMSQYVNVYGRRGNNMYGQLKSVMDVVLPAYQEAFEAGKMYALQDKAKQDTSSVSGGIATANTSAYTPATVFTREQIGRMSSDEFNKYEKQIRQQMMEGKIH